MANKSLGTLTLDLVAKTGGFVAGMTKAERESEKWKKKTKQQIRDVTESLVKLSTIGAAAAAAGFTTVAKASDRQAQAIAQVNQRLKSTEGAVGRTSEELQGMASALQMTTTFGDEAILEMQGLLLTFTGISGAVYDRTLPAVLDMSTALGTDLKSSALQVGKALNDPVKGISALAEAGIQFSDAQKAVVESLVESGKKAEAQKLILRELERQFGGSAKAAADTFGGAVKQVSNAFGDLLENPAGLEANKEAVQQLVGVLQDPNTIEAANKMTGALIGGFKGSIESIRTTIGLVGFVRDEVKAIFGIIDAHDRIRLEDRLLDINKKLESRVFTTLATQARINELLKEREYIQDRLIRLDPLSGLLEFDVDAIRAKYLEPIDIPVSIAPNREKLAPIEVFAAKIKTPESIAEGLKLNEQAQAIQESLKSEEQRLRESYERRRGIVLKNTKVVGEERNELLLKLEDELNSELETMNAGFWDKYLLAAGENLKNLDQLSAETLTNFSSRIGGAFESMIFDATSAEEAIHGLAEGMSRSIVNALGQMAAEWLAYQVVQLAVGRTAQTSAATTQTANALAMQQMAALNAFASTAAIPITGPILAPAAAAAAIAATSPFVAGVTSLSISGIAHDGLMSVPQTGTYLLEKGERVTTEETSKKLDRTLENVGGAPRARTDRPINIHNHFSAEEAFEAGAATSSGERAVMNVIRRNQATIRRMKV